MAYCRFLGAVLVGTVVVLAAVHAQAPGTAPSASPQHPPAKTPDIEKVERLMAARRDYQLALERLRLHYIDNGDIERAKWAEEELIQFHRIQKHAFVLDLDVPPPGLKASTNIPKANDLFKEAMNFKDKGWSGNDYLDNQRRAELLLQKILTMYPESNKIGEVAYQLGDIYESKVYKDYRRAALYFERSYQWNPNTQSDARLRAARLYDKHLSERSHAMEIYREVVTHETDPKRIAEAEKRMAELSGKK